MSTPYKDEFGDWKGSLRTENIDNFNYNIPGAGDTLKTHHQKDYEEIYKLKGLQQNDALKKIAFKNIKSYPLKYTQNIFYNIGRIIFDYPFSYAIQQPKHLFVFIFNGIIFTLTLLCLIPTFIKWQKIIFPIRFILFFVLLYLGASSLISSETRMFSAIVPILLLWIAFMFQKTIRINMKW
jgi:predicted RND superfamily exporter protein